MDTTDYGALKITPEHVSADGTPIATQETTGNRMELRLIDAKSGHNRHAVNTTTTLLDKFYWNGALGESYTADTRLSAGQRLVEDWERTGNRPQMGASYTPFGGSGQSEETPEEKSAALRYNHAVNALKGFDKTVVVKVCLWNEMCDGLDLQRLCRGLDALAAHYGMR